MILVETAYAKINLALHVRGRRADGYHEIESLFAFMDDGDVLTAEFADALTLTIDGPFAQGLDAGPDNLVMKAALALLEIAGPRGAALRLTKRLPVASGIGGGSADAAAALRLLVRLWDLEISEERMLAIALALGSDVPACIASETQWVGGRGERLVSADVAGVAGLPILLINPLVACPTGQVFAGWDGIDRGPLEAAAYREGRNDLTAAASARLPVIRDILDWLAAREGATLVRMAGSGATCFAVFDAAEALADAARAVAVEHPRWWAMAGSLR